METASIQPSRDDDVLVVYFRREAKRTIRMVGIYDHDTIPDDE